MARIAQEVRRAYAACAAALVSGGVDLDAIDALGLNVEMPVFTVSQAAQIAGVHPQTLRQYDRLGLVVPQRTGGGARRYTLRDVARLAQAQQLSQDEGINLAGVTHILSLQEENRQLRRQIRHLRRRLDGDSVFEAGMDGEVVEVRQSPFYHVRRRGRAYIAPLQITSNRRPSSRHSPIWHPLDGTFVVWGRLVSRHRPVLFLSDGTLGGCWMGSGGVIRNRRQLYVILFTM